MTDKPHLSATQLEMYWRCPEQYRRRYLEHETVPPGVAMILGTGVHRGAEINFRQKIESRRDLPVKDIIEAAVAGFEAEISGGLSLLPEEAARGREIVIGEAKDQTAALAQLHATNQAPDYQPIEVEHTTRIVFRDATHDLIAVTDLRDDRKRVTDFKTGARRKRQSDVDSSTQLTIYSASYLVDHGELPSEVRLDTLVKAKTPARQVLASLRTRKDLEVLLARINATLLAINLGVFPPCSPGSWGCSPRWCGYAMTCPYFNAERQSAADQES